MFSPSIDKKYHRVSIGYMQNACRYACNTERYYTYLVVGHDSICNGNAAYSHYLRQAMLRELTRERGVPG
jgi:hypothetical protein